MRRRRRLSACVVALVLLGPAVASAQESIVSVEVQGTKRVEASAVRVNIHSAAGQRLDRDTISEDIKRVYGMGFFENVWATTRDARGGVALTFHVQERPYVEKIEFHGRKEVDKADLEAVINVRPRTIFDPQKAWEGLQAARKLYAGEGYPDVKIDYHVETYGDNQARVMYDIKEGDLIRVSDIRFEGVKAFTPRKLRKVMSTKEKWFLSFLTGAGLLNEDELKADVERLTAFYYDNGYIHVRIDEPIVERKKGGLVITIKIDEGKQFRVGDISFDGDLLMSKRDLRKTSGIHTGDIFRASSLRESIFSLVEAYGNLGYAFADVTPLTAVREADGRVDVRFRFKSGPPVKVRRILIRGNTKTRDYVIRREIELQEGQPFSGVGLRKSRDNIRALGFFSNVELTTNRTEKDDEVDLLVEVQEGRTGAFSAGAGFSSSDAFVFNARISEQNLFGRGQSAVFNADFGSIRQNLQLSFTEPWVGDRPLSVGGDLFHWNLDFNDFTRGGTGFAIRASYPLEKLGYKDLFGLSLDRVRVGLEYRLEEAKIDGISQDAPASIKLEEGSRLTSSISPRLIRSTLNHPFDPTRGSRQVLSAEFAGLGGATDFIKLEASGRWFTPVYKTKAGREFVYSFGGTIGYGIGDTGASGEELPLFERYFPGGINSVRGFDTRSLGPLEPFCESDGQSPGNSSRCRMETVGGSQQLIFNNDLIFPILQDAGVKGVLFFDAGNAFTAADGIDLGGLRLAIGWGIRWLSPLGPLRIEVGYPLDRKSNESASVVLFSFGAPL